MLAIRHALAVLITTLGLCKGAVALDQAAGTPQGDSPRRLVLLEPELEGDLEDATRVPGWNRKMANLDTFLREQMSARGLYMVLPNAAASDLLEQFRGRREVHDCVPCIQDVARRLGAERAMVVWVFRMSELVMWLYVRVVEPESGQIVVARSMTFRGDNDRAWGKAAEFFLRQLAEVPSKAR